jgi:hypothetical protein
MPSHVWRESCQRHHPSRGFHTCADANWLMIDAARRLNMPANDDDIVEGHRYG